MAGAACSSARQFCVRSVFERGRATLPATMARFNYSCSHDAKHGQARHGTVFALLSSVMAASNVVTIDEVWAARRRMLDDLLTELRERAGERAGEVKLIETHVSWVLLGADEVYKIKKPVKLPFLDFSTFERREEACRNEVRINRRLAPRTYLGVAPVRKSPKGQHTFGSRGVIVDWAVRMKRLDESRRADNLLIHHKLTREQVDAVAVAIASFHADSPSTPRIAWFGAPERIQSNAVANFTALHEEAASDLITEGGMDEIERWQGSFLGGHRDLFEQRMIDGAIRDGHGDLRLEHVFFDGDDASPKIDFEIIDGIEFDDRYRLGDVCADIAFFAMDLARLGRVDLAERFIAMYARAANDFELYRLVDFYESYRACVRAKIAAGVAGDHLAPEAVVDMARAEARRYLLLAQSVRRRSVIGPVVVAIGGSIATGKSTLAERLAEELSAPIIDADRTRKFLLGVRPTEHDAADTAWKGAYDPEFSAKVYSEVLRRADAVLSSGRPVILDASFRTKKARAAARELASQHNVPFRLIECVSPIELSRTRLEARQASSLEKDKISDATTEILDAFTKAYEPIDELSPTEHIKVDSSGSIESAIAEVEREIETWPRGLVG